MLNDIKLIIDKLVPRGGGKPLTIHVSLEEYLSRLANFNRKITGTYYRIDSWKKLFEENKIVFEKQMKSMDDRDSFTSGKSEKSFKTFSFRDAGLENEFEVLLYSMTSTLSSLTRIVVCFLEGSTQSHSHSKLPNILSKYPDFNKSYSLVVDACKLWTDELTKRRDAATHYIALSASSFIKHSKSELDTIDKTFSHLQIIKYPEKYNSLWDDELPTLGGSSQSHGFDSKNGSQIHELMDLNGVIVVRREQPLEEKPEFIECEEYLQKLCFNFEQYVKNVLSSLIPKI